jgi:hypothetical protein
MGPDEVIMSGIGPCSIDKGTTMRNCTQGGRKRSARTKTLRADGNAQCRRKRSTWIDTLNADPKAESGPRAISWQCSGREGLSGQCQGQWHSGAARWHGQSKQSRKDCVSEGCRRHRDRWNGRERSAAMWKRRRQ